MKSKVCTKCKLIKKLIEFPKSYRSKDKDGRTHWCKRCFADYAKRYIKIKVKIPLDNKKYYKPEKLPGLTKNQKAGLEIIFEDKQ